ncbi:MAG TPA: NUDIX domain-containing protein [Clostridia bacterium]|nr:NUDIX domain-containing protein [Clostridia bacterium]
MEQWDVLDAQGNPVGRLHTRGVPMAKGDYHLVVDIWIQDDAGRYLIARRAPQKEPFAGCWAMTCGCAVAGDDSLAAALREVREELGLELDPKAGRMRRRWVDPAVGSIVDAWFFRQNVRLGDVVLQLEETDQAAWADREEILRMIADGRFVDMDRVPYAEELL